jgi:hypothetical protein
MELLIGRITSSVSCSSILTSTLFSDILYIFLSQCEKLRFRTEIKLQIKF